MRVNISNVSHYSLRQATSRPSQIVKLSKEYGYDSVGLIDIGTISGVVPFISECKKAGLKPVVGCRLNICTINRLDEIVLVVRSKTGWKNLIKLVTEHSTRNLTFSDFRDKGEGLMAIASSHFYLSPKDWYREYKNVFDRVFIPNNEKLAKELSADYIYINSSYYPKKENREDLQILLCTEYKNTLKRVLPYLSKQHEKFFTDNSYHILRPEESFNDGREELVKEIDDDLGILHPPGIPQVKSDIPFRELCHSLLRNKGLDNATYRERLNNELDILEEANLAGYFLICRDIIGWAKYKKGWLCGPARGCLHPKTPILTNYGIVKNIEDVNIGDKVLTKDGSYKKVNKVFKYDCEEQLHEITTYFSDFQKTSLTGDHKVLCEKVIRPKNWENYSEDIKKKRKSIVEPKNELKWVQAKDIEKDDWLFVPVPKRNIEDIKEIDLSIYSDELHTHDNDFCYHYQKNYLTKNIKLLHKYRRRIVVNYDFFKILGLFTGDGWLLKDKWKKQKIGFAFNSSQEKDMRNFHFVKNYFESIGCKTSAHYHNDRNLVQLYCNCYHFAMLLRSLFCDYDYKSITKHVPQFIFSQSKERIKNYLIGYAESDGYIRNNQVKFTTISKRLAEQVRYLLLCIGKPSSISKNERKDRREEYKNTKTNYVVTYPIKETNYYRKVSNGILLKVIKNEIVENESKIVYDLSIGDKEEEHNFTTTSFNVHNSAGGCLTSYVLGITEIDPLKHGLLFSRFYNHGRNTGGHISLPDIDMDFPKYHRDEVISYIRDTYGKDKVSKISTYGRLMGAGAITEVLAKHEFGSNFEIKKISKRLPMEAKIEDKMKEFFGDEDRSIIKWVLHNDKELLQEYAHWDEGEQRVVGPLSAYFEQAIRLEGVYRNQGIHASGIFISDVPIIERCPLVPSKDKELVAGMEMDEAKKVGLVKFDILGVVVLDKLMMANKFILEGLNNGRKNI